MIGQRYKEDPARWHGQTSALCHIYDASRYQICIHEITYPPSTARCMVAGPHHPSLDIASNVSSLLSYGLHQQSSRPYVLGSLDSGSHPLNVNRLTSRLREAPPQSPTPTLQRPAKDHQHHRREAGVVSLSSARAPHSKHTRIECRELTCQHSGLCRLHISAAQIERA